MDNKNKSAFSVPPNGDIGLTKREYIAALALQGLLANGSIFNSFDKDAENAVKAADALLAELDKPNNE